MQQRSQTWTMILLSGTRLTPLKEQKQSFTCLTTCRTGRQLSLQRKRLVTCTTMHRLSLLSILRLDQLKIHLDKKPSSMEETLSAQTVIVPRFRSDLETLNSALFSQELFLVQLRFKSRSLRIQSLISCMSTSQ